MVKSIFVVYDSKGEFYSPPMLFVSKGEAIRSFSEWAVDQSIPIGKHPADFTLFSLGTWDDSSAKYQLHSTPISICTALDFAKSTA